MGNMNVILFSEDYLPTIGGVQTHVHELARALQGVGHYVPVVTSRLGFWYAPRTWPCRTVVRDGVTALELSTVRLPRDYRICWRWRWRRAMQKLVRDGRFSGAPLLVHVHSGSLSWFKAECVRVFTNHTSGFLQDVENGRSERWRREFEQYHWIIAPSQELADKTIQVGFDAERVTYIPNGVDTERFRPDGALRAEVRRDLGISNADVVILCARRVTPKNGVIDFAHSLRFVGGAGQKVNVVFAGNSEDPDDNYEKETLGAIQLSPIGREARLVGKVPNSRMHRLYAAADISVLPSLKEATSITGLESMACALPLVGTKVGGIPDLIDEGQTGFLVERGDPRGLSTALDRLIANGDLRRAMGTCAREKAIRYFDWKCIAERTREVYMKALQVHKGRSE